MGEFCIPLLAVMEKTHSGGLCGRLPIRRSKSWDDLFTPAHDIADEKPYVLNSEFLFVPHSCEHGDKSPSTTTRDDKLKSKIADLRPSYEGGNNRVWKDWDAAVLLSKWEEEKKREASSYLLRDDIYFVKDIIQKGCCCEVCLSPSSKKDCETLYMTAKAVTALTTYGISLVDLSMFEDKLSAEKCDELYFTLFSSVARTVLSIFDMEDFKRIYNCEEVRKEYEVFCSRLRGLDHDPYVAFAKGLVKYDDLSNLREHDFCYILNKYQEATGNADIKVSPYFLLDEHEVDINVSDIYTAMDVIESYFPLKEYYKTELTLELMHRKCYNVFDSMVIKTLKRIPLDTLFGYVPHLKYSRDENEANEASKLFIEGVIDGLHLLAALKSSMLKHVRYAITSSPDKFKPYVDDMVELLVIADLERRNECSRFIGPQHVLFGLSLSRYGYCSRELQYLGDRASDFSFIKLCESARGFASAAGQKIDLLHLIRAMLLLEKDHCRREELEGRIFAMSRMRTEMQISEVESFQHPAWKDWDIFSRFQLEWTTSTGAKLVCSRRVMATLEDRYAPMSPTMFHPQRFVGPPHLYVPWNPPRVEHPAISAAALVDFKQLNFPCCGCVMK